MDTESAARRWRETWLRAWPAKDVDAIAALYADGAVLRSHPFREPQGLREYLEWAFSEQDDVACWFGEPVVDGMRSAIEYWGVVSFQGRDETIVGISMLRFGRDRLVLDHRDLFTAEEGRREPPPGWGL